MINSMPEEIAVQRDYAEMMQILEQQINYTKRQHTQTSQLTHTAFRQCTLKQPVSFQGATRGNSHSVVSVVLRPADVNTGIIFRRIDLKAPCSIPATLQSLTPNALQLNLRKKDVDIKSISHLLSAFSGLGIDNAYVDIAGNELPIMDGSACQFLFLIKSAGIVVQPALKHFIRIKERVTLTQENASICIEPYEGFQIGCEIRNKHLAAQQYQIDLSSQAYTKEIVRARYNASHLAKHECRYPDEAPRHLILDLVGHLYILGFQIIGSVKLQQVGNVLHYPLIMRLLQQSHAWEYVTFQKGVYSSQNIHPTTSAIAI